jgi:KTSC domain
MIVRLGRWGNLRPLPHHQTTGRTMGRFYSADQITWREVESSNVTAVGWDKYGRMYVRFPGGALYMYEGVSRQRAVATAYAKSVGSYINHVIKPNFTAVKVA